MIAETGKQLAGTKQNGKPQPVAEATKARTKNHDDTAVGVTATKAVRTAGQKSGKSNGAAKQAGSEQSQSKPPTDFDMKPDHMTTSGIEPSGDEASAKSAVDADANGNGVEGTDKVAGNGANGATSSKVTGDAIKPLTEAGKKRLVNKLLGLADSQATQGAFKITPADLIRLMQLHREMNPQKDRKVTVQWIEDKPE